MSPRHVVSRQHSCRASTVFSIVSHWSQDTHETAVRWPSSRASIKHCLKTTHQVAMPQATSNHASIVSLANASPLSFRSATGRYLNNYFLFAVGTFTSWCKGLEPRSDVSCQWQYCSSDSCQSCRHKFRSVLMHRTETINFAFVWDQKVLTCLSWTK